MAERTLLLPSTETPGKVWSLVRQRVLGAGGYGQASLVIETGHPSSAMVAKEVSLQQCKSEQEREAIFREIQIMRAVQHPNVVRFIDSYLDRDRDRITILMEYCDGGDLSAFIADAARRVPVAGVPEPQVWSILTQLTMALKCLHLEHRVLHRDLKPSNIFMMADGTVKLGDFGVATVLSQSVHYAKSFCGSPHYLAPELCTALPYNGKVDVWAVGCVLYEIMARGRRAFDAPTLLALVARILSVDYEPIDAAIAADATPPAPPLEAATFGPGESLHTPTMSSAASLPSSPGLPSSAEPYSEDLKRLVTLLLQKEPNNRASLCRLLRNPTLLAYVPGLPPHLASDPHYVAQFRQRPSQGGSLSPSRGPFGSFSNPPASSSGSAPLSPASMRGPPSAAGTAVGGCLSRTPSALASPRLLDHTVMGTRGRPPLGLLDDPVLHHLSNTQYSTAESVGTAYTHTTGRPSFSPRVTPPPLHGLPVLHRRFGSVEAAASFTCGLQTPGTPPGAIAMPALSTGSARELLSAERMAEVEELEEMAERELYADWNLQSPVVT